MAGKLRLVPGCIVEDGILTALVCRYCHKPLHFRGIHQLCWCKSCNVGCPECTDNEVRSRCVGTWLKDIEKGGETKNGS